MQLDELKPRMKEYDSEPEWLSARHPGMGSSDSAGVLGWSPFDSPYSKWYQKSNPPDTSPSRGMTLDNLRDLKLWGHLHEETIADVFQQMIDAHMIPELDGCEVGDPGEYTLIWGAPPDDRCFCTVDRLIVRGSEVVAPLECKCAFFARIKEFDEALPMAYRCQASHQMLCLGPDVKRAYYACLLGGCDFRWYSEARNEKFLDAMRRQYAKFWQRVENGCAPSPDAHEATRHAITKQYPADNGDIVYLPEEAGEIDTNLVAVRARISLDQRRETALANRMRIAIGNAQVGVIPDGTAAWTWKSNKAGHRTLKRTKWPKTKGR